MEKADAVTRAVAPCPNAGRHYNYYEMDFARRLIAKFHLNLKMFWHSKNFMSATDGAL
jgi:hypothetical protein